ncbi:hypothetical protein N7499_007568 [Penicillium canescens]|uniref:Uncharacterized protein n=1 Tax=Penicillium canescens TaxID=5083 RepID=A0AAD6IGS8_PENCN|nr:uncharacterized protein N7446_003265 [Penicillium canescens]KAJ5996117.1 hypothetical protein N7522_007777 [Penicillium canescens]KAJ6045063.1 hypothetical protein N7460_006418 [Penicillium canescens]KAJ6056533.1 hypothetical protein N7444_005631 [Penicillium canescens]KAJ6075488.1 hypothetical protein N7446_003265 [Penicillium canescens]KAJ6082694.1 hypothetical protein N7499_007568 [Penicillium canescens]
MLTPSTSLFLLSRHIQNASCIEDAELIEHAEEDDIHTLHSIVRSFIHATKVTEGFDDEKCGTYDKEEGHDFEDQ